MSSHTVTQMSRSCHRPPLIQLELPSPRAHTARPLLSKHRESLYRGGRFRHWVKIKNRAHPAFSRVQDQF